MRHLSKRIKEISKRVDRTKAYGLKEAIEVVKGLPKVKFDEGVDLHLHLSVDPKQSDQIVRGTVVLPHGTGKKVRIAVFCKGEQEAKAKELGADYVGAQELIDKVAAGFLDFDCAIATPEMMKDLSKLGKVLGPRGLMPSPKTGTVTQDISRAIKEVKAGKIEYKTDKQAGVHVCVGKLSFTAEQLHDNANCVLEAIKQSKPSSVKGEFIKSIFIATTMGAGLRITP